MIELGLPGNGFTLACFLNNKKGKHAVSLAALYKKDMQMSRQDGYNQGPRLRAVSTVVISRDIFTVGMGAVVCFMSSSATNTTAHFLAAITCIMTKALESVTTFYVQLIVYPTGFHTIVQSVLRLTDSIPNIITHPNNSLLHVFIQTKWFHRNYVKHG